MNERRISRAEEAAYELLRPSVPGELSNLCVRMEFPHTPSESESRAETIRKLWYFCKDMLAGTALADLEMEIYKMRPTLPKPHYLVYLNCSDRERKDSYAWQFFGDLMKALNSDYPNCQLRYFDEGSSSEVLAWNPWALRAMQEAKVMICLYTKDFFLQPYCGQVWRAFREGSENEQRAHGTGAPLVLPILWTAPGEYLDNLPRVARELAFPDETLGTKYCEHGLFYLMRRRNPNDVESLTPYVEFLANCADNLRELLRGTVPQTRRSPPSLDEIPSDFAGLAQDPESVPQLGVDSPRFVYLSARKQEIKPVRNPEPYGTRRNSWAPFHPSRKEQIEQLSKRVAWEQRLAPEELELDGDFVPNLQKAHREGSFIMVIVDPWTMALESYQRYASEYDAVNLPGSTLLICLNPEDRETQTVKSSALRARVRKAFPNKFHRDSPERFRPEAASMSSLLSTIRALLTMAHSHAVAEAPEVRPAEGQAFDRPLIVPSLSASTRPAAPERTAAPAESAPISLPRLTGPIREGEI